ncbi:MAG: hypothetical protein LBF51_08605 [Zoogloeaceae bacterium]|nr:hypothetical protein [Zoogloeaceae bacterium]
MQISRFFVSLVPCLCSAKIPAHDSDPVSARRFVEAVLSPQRMARVSVHPSCMFSREFDLMRHGKETGWRIYDSRLRSSGMVFREIDDTPRKTPVQAAP